MVPYKKIFAGAGIISFLAIGIAATSPEKKKVYFKNLKVLDKYTTEDDMERIMYGFQRQVGVGCDYCHMPAKNDSDMNFDADGKKAKDISRDMLKMTIQLNKKYFNKKMDERLITKPVIWCRTCHRGYPKPWRDKF